MDNTSKEIQDKWVEAIKDCGQSLIDNAEKIAGEYKFQTSIYISMLLNPGEFVEISVDTKFIPQTRADKNKLVVLPSSNKIEFAK